LNPSGVYLHRVRVEEGPREHGQVLSAKGMTAEKVGSEEETEKPKILWPELLAHRNIKGDTQPKEK